jgi:predicted amidohydrolase
MARIIRIGAAQLGPIQKIDGRAVVVERMLGLLEQAHGRGCHLVVYPELALTTFFPRWDMSDGEEIDAWFETSMPNPATMPLFDRARDLGVGLSFGYAEMTREDGELRRYNTSVLVDRSGGIVGRYRKTHLPGYADFQTDCAFQHLEKKYFLPGNTGFKVWRTMGGIFGMCICNDRRWPETYRVMGLQGVEMVLVGFNTPRDNFDDTSEDVSLRIFQNELSVQAGAYQNSTWVVAVAKAGNEDGHDLLGGSTIVHPSGQIVARSKTLDDELVVADCDLDACNFNKETIFNFGAHRRIEHYGLICSQADAVRPD